MRLLDWGSGQRRAEAANVDVKGALMSVVEEDVEARSGTDIN
jgi:hypothetical protein